jgi:hypothetical protein
VVELRGGSAEAGELRRELRGERSGRHGHRIYESESASEGLGCVVVVVVVV